MMYTPHPIGLPACSPGCRSQLTRTSKRASPGNWLAICFCAAIASDRSTAWTSTPFVVEIAIDVLLEGVPALDVEGELQPETARAADSVGIAINHIMGLRVRGAFFERNGSGRGRSTAATRLAVPMHRDGHVRERGEHLLGSRHQRRPWVGSGKVLLLGRIFRQELAEL